MYCGCLQRGTYHLKSDPIKQIYTKPQNTLLTQTFSAMNIINPFLHYIQLLAHDNHSRLIMKNIEI